MSPPLWSLLHNAFTMDNKKYLFFREESSISVRSYDDDDHNKKMMKFSYFSKNGGDNGFSRGRRNVRR